MHYIADNYENHGSGSTMDIICTRIIHNHHGHAGFSVVQLALEDVALVITSVCPRLLNKTKILYVPVLESFKARLHTAQQYIMRTCVRRIMVFDTPNFSVSECNMSSFLGIIAALFTKKTILLND